MKRHKKQHLFRADGLTPDIPDTPSDVDPGIGAGTRPSADTDTPASGVQSDLQNGGTVTATTKQLADALRSATVTHVYRPAVSPTVGQQLLAVPTAAQLATLDNLRPADTTDPAAAKQPLVAEGSGEGQGQGGSPSTARVRLDLGGALQQPEPAAPAADEPTPDTPADAPADQPQAAAQWTLLGVSMRPLYWVIAALATLIVSAVTIKYLVKE